MGKGDRRTKRGKLFRGTFGATRKHKKQTTGAGTSSASKAESSAPAKSGKKSGKKKKEE